MLVPVTTTKEVELLRDQFKWTLEARQAQGSFISLKVSRPKKKLLALHPLLLGYYTHD
jgi:hypothetical protein